jgi:hypothetical protein
MQGIELVRKMAVACYNQQGEADFFVCRVELTNGGLLSTIEDKFLLGWQHEVACKIAAEQGCEGPMVAFDCEDDKAGRAISSLFDWDESLIYGS